LAHLITVHISHSWVASAIASVVRYTPWSRVHLYVACLPRCT